jgi:hypothetical protein
MKSNLFLIVISIYGCTVPEVCEYIFVGLGEITTSIYSTAQVRQKALATPSTSYLTFTCFDIFLNFL